MVLRRVPQCCEFIAAKRNENAPGRLSEGAHRFGNVARFDPPIAGNGKPWRPPQHHQRHVGLVRSSDGIARDDAGVRVSGVNECIDPLAHEIIRKTRGAAKAAAANRNRLAHRRGGAAGERHGDFKVGAARQPLRQYPRLRGAAKNKDFSRDFWHVAA